MFVLEYLTIGVIVWLLLEIIITAIQKKVEAKLPDEEAAKIAKLLKDSWEDTGWWKRGLVVAFAWPVMLFFFFSGVAKRAFGKKVL